jgi:hypothetical protein
MSSRALINSLSISSVYADFFATRFDMAPHAWHLSHPARALRYGAVRTIRDQAVGDAASVGPYPRSPFADLLEKCLPLLTEEDFDELQSRLQENTITVEPSAVCGAIFARVKEIKF